MQNVLIVAGEASGDMLGAGLVKEFAALNPDLKFFGFGGDRMSSAGVELIYHIRQLAILGIWEAIKNYRYIKNIQKQLLKTIRERKPSMAILIDYPGFNLNLAPKLKAMGIAVFYYVSPQIWAWGAGRIKKIKRNVDLMAVLFDFEKALYDKEGVPTVWVSHPMLDEIAIKRAETEFRNGNGISTDEFIIGLFPGSRQLEVKRLLPGMLQAMVMITRRYPNARALIAKAESLDESLYEDIFEREKLSAPFCAGANYELMAYSRLCLVCSGTATLECGVVGTPLIVLYKTSFLTYVIARLLIKIEYIGLVNIISKRSIVPELIQKNCTPERIAAESISFLDDLARYRSTKSALAALRNHLGEAGASNKAARAASDLLKRINNVKPGY